MIASIMTKDKKQMVPGRIEVFADDWQFYPDSLNNPGKLEADVEFLTKSNPATGAVFLMKLPNYDACYKHLDAKDVKRYARCISTMASV